MTRRLRREQPVHLTPAEAQVLSFLPTYLTVEAIAKRIGRSRSTVKTHVAHIYDKLGVGGRGEAVERAWELGFLAEPGSRRAVVATRPAGTTRASRPADPGLGPTEMGKASDGTSDHRAEA